MGLFSSKSSSSSQQTTNNTSTSIGVQGDNTGFITNGNNNSFHVTTTDHNLVAAVEGINSDLTDAFTNSVNVVGDMHKDNNIMTERLVGDGFNFATNVLSDSLNAIDSVTGQGFDIAADSIGAIGKVSGQGLDLASDAIYAQNDLTLGSLQHFADLSSDAISANSNLASDVASLAESMHASNIGFANSMVGETISAIKDSNNNIYDLARFTTTNNSDLARDFAANSADLASMAIDSTSEAFKTAYKDSSDQTILAHKQALQFVDNMSRSDGQQLALNTNKTMMYVVIGIVIISMFAMKRS